MDIDEEDLVISFEWDFLSTDYLLVLNVYYGIRLIDIEFMNVIMNFKLLSLVIKIYILVWIFFVFGIFVIGGKLLK